MVYRGQFRNINDELYQIIIDSGYTQVRDIELTTTPIVVELEGNGGEDIFKPVKYSSATIGVVTNGTNDYMFDIFSSTPQQVSVKLQKVNEEAHTSDTVWMGYVEPSVYDMGFNSDREEFEIECIDDLATLQYYRYTPTDAPTIKSYLDIIKQILRGHTRYKKLYVAERFAVGEENTKLSLDKLYVSELNFINKEDASENWTEQEVLEEICNYLNLTLYAEGEDLYMIDYYTRGEGTEYNLVNDTEQHKFYFEAETIDGRDYASTGSSISMNPAFNRVSVTSKVNSYEVIIPELFQNSSYTSQTNFTDWYIRWRDDNYVTNLQRQDTKTYSHYILVENPNYRLYTYQTNGTPKTLEWSADSSYDDFVQNVRSTMGAFLLKTKFTATVESDTSDAYISKKQEDWKDYLLIANHDTEDKYKVLESVATYEDGGYYVNNDAYLILNCTALFMDKQGWEYIPTDYNNKKSFDAINMYIPAVIQWGDYYFHNGGGRNDMGIDNGFTNAGSWNTEFGYCRIQFDCTDTSNLLNTPHKILDTSGRFNTIQMDSGLIIPPPPKPQTTQPKITLFTRGRINSGVRNEYIWVSDFSFKLVIPQRKKVTEEDWESDTQYSNVINENYVENGSDMECKINTYDRKVPSHSYTLYKEDDDSDLIYLDEVKGLINAESHRLEEQKIYDYVTQYKEPSLTLEINHRNLHLPTSASLTVPIISEDKRFIIDSYSKDYYNSINKIKIVEKKWIF